MRLTASLILIAAIAIVAWFFRDTWRGRQAPPGTPISSRSLPAPKAAPPVPAPRPAATPRATAEADGTGGAQVERQARKYVARLTAPEPQPIRVEKADNFVTGDQLFSLIPESASEKTTVAKIIEETAATPDSPITIVKKVEQIQRMSPEKLIAGSAGDLDQPVRQLVGDKVRTTTVRKVLEAASQAPEAPIDIVTEVEYFEQTTPAELAKELESDDALKADTVINVISKPHGLEAASMGDLMRTREPPPTPQDSLTREARDEDSLYYVRTVRADDRQGIWGILQDGIIKNFARGMAIRRGREINTYQVDIPRDSDEKIAGNSSSFLGRLIYRKSNESYVFNYRNNRMGHNPDRIYPGQEIVIINFKPDELISIYKHFVAQRG